MKIVYVGGAKGVGKTTTMNELVGLTIPNHTILSVTGSSLLYESTQRILGKSWSGLMVSERIEARRLVRNTLLSLPADIVFLDSHYTDMIDGIPSPIIPENIENIIDVHIVLEADPRLVLERRLKDITSRGDRDLDIINIAREIQGERDEAVRLAHRTGNPLHVFDNIDVDTTAKKIIEISKIYLVNKEREGHYEGFFHHKERI